MEEKSKVLGLCMNVKLIALHFVHLQCLSFMFLNFIMAIWECDIRLHTESPGNRTWDPASQPLCLELGYYRTERNTSAVKLASYVGTLPFRCKSDGFLDTRFVKVLERFSMDFQTLVHKGYRVEEQWMIPALTCRLRWNCCFLIPCCKKLISCGLFLHLLEFSAVQNDHRNIWPYFFSQDNFWISAVAMILNMQLMPFNPDVGRLCINTSLKRGQWLSLRNDGRVWKFKCRCIFQSILEKKQSVIE